MQKKTEKELLDYIKLKNKLEILENSSNSIKRTKNPFESLTFNTQDSETKAQAENEKLKFLLSYKFWFTVFVILSLSVSLFFNQLVSLKFDPFLFNLVSSLQNQINKPYVLTVGNFESFDAAKNEAIELLPKLRQINIKELPTGNYAFEIEKYASKEDAYSASKDLIRDGFESVHVRYLQDQ